MKEESLMKFDVRTKFLMVMMASIVTFTVHNEKLFLITVLSLSVYLFILGQKKSVVKYLIMTLGILYILKMLSNTTDMFNVILIMMAFILRLIPLSMAAGPLFKENPSDIIALFEKIRLPKQLALPITFMLRFYPTVKHEISKTKNAIRLRGVLSISKPLVSLEYIFAPLMITCAKISDQLSAAAEVRGISNPNKHTSIRKLVLQKHDYVLTVIALIGTICLLVLDKRGGAL